MLCRCPSPANLPPLSLMLADLGNPRPAELARTLDVSLATVRRWVKADQAPRVAMLALFWLTRWGQSQVDCHTTNEARQLGGLVRALQAQLDQARADLARLESIGGYGSANTPLYRTAAPLPALPVSLATAGPRLQLVVSSSAPAVSA